MTEKKVHFDRSRPGSPYRPACNTRKSVPQERLTRVLDEVTCKRCRGLRETYEWSQLRIGTDQPAGQVVNIKGDR